MKLTKKRLWCLSQEMASAFEVFGKTCNGTNVNFSYFSLGAYYLVRNSQSVVNFRVNLSHLFLLPTDALCVMITVLYKSN